MLRHDGGEFLVTALHVAKGCGFQPRIRWAGEWREAKWETIATDEIADIAVLQSDLQPPIHPNLNPRYGRGEVMLGGVGRAMGFPALFDEAEVSHIGEMQGLPLAVSTVISAYWASNDDAKPGIEYLGGYINSGFSGGAIVLPTTNHGWTIAGVISERGAVKKSMFKRNEETGETFRIIYGEPSGLIRFAGIEFVIELLDGSRKS